LQATLDGRHDAPTPSTVSVWQNRLQPPAAISQEPRPPIRVARRPHARRILRQTGASRWRSRRPTPATSAKLGRAQFETPVNTDQGLFSTISSGERSHRPRVQGRSSSLRPSGPEGRCAFRSRDALRNRQHRAGGATKQPPYIACSCRPKRWQRRVDRVGADIPVRSPATALPRSRAISSRFDRTKLLDIFAMRPARSAPPRFAIFC